MICKGVVRDNVVLLEAGAQLPDGAEVEVRLLEHSLTADRKFKALFAPSRRPRPPQHLPPPAPPHPECWGATPRATLARRRPAPTFAGAGQALLHGVGESR